MGDKNTITKLRLNGDFSRLTETSDSLYWRSISSKKKEFLVITEDDGDIFDSFLERLNLKKKDLPKINAQKYRRDFLMNNHDVIYSIRKRNMAITNQTYDSLSIEDLEWVLEEQEDYTNYLDSMKELFTKKDGIHYHHSYLDDLSNGYLGFLDGYPENAFYKVKRRALIFEFKYCTIMSAYIFGKFNFDCPDDSLKRFFFLRDAMEHFIGDPSVYQERVEDLIRKHESEDDDLEPMCVFSFG